MDTPLPHLDRPFDYLVPEPLSGPARPGVRVRVRFAGRLTDAYVLERAERSDFPGRLSFLERVVSPEPVLGPELAALARAVADRYGGTLADVLRLAIPPRHAGAERDEGLVGGGSRTAGPFQPSGERPDSKGPAVRWDGYHNGASFLRALAEARSPRAVWAALPGIAGDGVPGWAREIADAVGAVLASGRGSVVVVPDANDLAVVDQALGERLGGGRHVSLAARLGPAERYRRWLAAARGQVRVVAGTRSAAFAPIADLGLVVIWDDGDDLHSEPRAPYPHARDVLLLRAHLAGSGALLGGFARTAEGAALIASGWARALAAGRPEVRNRVPLVRAAGEDAELARDEAARMARIPALALRTAREGLASGPVLVQVPRRGYLAAVGCQSCRARIRCASCSGPIALGGPDQRPACDWCATPAPEHCPECGATGLRAVVTGARRTAEEFGRAFPATTVLTSSGENVIGAVPGRPAIVIATPGAEPRAAGGYASAVLLDGWALLGRASLRAGEEALRRWLNAAALVRPGPAGGQVVVLADPALTPVQALIRWDPAGYSERELAERAELGFPPAMRMASLSGPADIVRTLLDQADLPVDAQVLGPVPVGYPDPGAGRGEVDPAVRFLIRVPSASGTALAIALRAVLAGRSARKDPGVVRLRLDPAELA